MIKNYYQKYYELWTNGANCLLHYRFELEKNPSNILLFFTAPADLCMPAYNILKEKYINAKFTIAFNESKKNQYGVLNDENNSLIEFPDKEQLSAKWFEREILSEKPQFGWDSVFFIYTIDLSFNCDPQQIFLANQHYRNLKDIADLLCIEYTYFIGPHLKIHHIDELFPKGTILTEQGTCIIPDSLLSSKELQALFDRSYKLPPNSLIVEIGHYLGGSTICLAIAAHRGNKNAVISVDNHANQYKETKQIFLKNLSKHRECELVTPHFCSAHEFINYRWQNIMRPVSLIHIDADKNYHAAMEYLRFGHDYLINGGYLIHEDYSCCFGVMEAVKSYMKANNRFVIEEEISPMLILRKI